MEHAAVNIVPEGRLRLSRSPVAELAAAALRAKEAAGIDAAAPAEYVIVACPPGTAEQLAPAVKAAVDRHQV